MRRLLVFGLIAGLAVGAGPGAADAKSQKNQRPSRAERKVDFQYLCPCVGIIELGSQTSQNLGGGPMEVRAQERYLTAEAVDITGLTVPVEIDQDTDGDGALDPVAGFCGQTDSPIRIKPRLELGIFINAGFPLVCNGATVLGGGTIHFILSNQK